MLTRLLERAGLFVGYNKEGNNEAIFFLQLNEWMLRQANASWDNPYNFQFINQELEEYFVEVLQAQLRANAPAAFLGPNLATQHPDLHQLSFSWGWKDPRNCITLHIWKRIFPDMKVLNIYRNPIDIAYSLHKRELSYAQRMEASLVAHPGKVATGEFKRHRSPRVFHLHEGVKLWKEYLQQVDKQRGLFSSADWRDVHYEEFLQNPVGTLTDLVQFCGMDNTVIDIAELAKDVKQERRYAFTQNPSLTALYNEVRTDPLIQSLGYGDIPLE